MADDSPNQSGFTLGECLSRQVDAADHVVALPDHPNFLGRLNEIEGLSRIEQLSGTPPGQQRACAANGTSSSSQALPRSFRFMNCDAQGFSTGSRNRRCVRSVAYPSVSRRHC
jgi:hypothetical protein